MRKREVSLQLLKICCEVAKAVTLLLGKSAAERLYPRNAKT